jgi:hypothetical protein
MIGLWTCGKQDHEVRVRWLAMAAAADGIWHAMAHAMCKRLQIKKGQRSVQVRDVGI